MLQIAQNPVWWIVLFLILLVNIVIAFIINIAIAEKFGKGLEFGISLALLGFIFYPMLEFGNASYRG